MPVTMNADKNGPRKTPTGSVHISRGLLNGSSPTPRPLERTNGSSTSHEPAKAMMKKEISGCLASRFWRGQCYSVVQQKLE
jgi:hypothetical protein